MHTKSLTLLRLNKAPKPLHNSCNVVSDMLLAILSKVVVSDVLFGIDITDYRPNFSLSQMNRTNGDGVGLLPSTLLRDRTRYVNEK